MEIVSCARETSALSPFLFVLVMGVVSECVAKDELCSGVTMVFATP